MTTTVIVQAHVPKEKQVRVTKTEGNDVEYKFLQDGESASFTIYDAKELRVTEEMKPT